MVEHKFVCKECILPDGFLGVTINSNGLCNFCANPTHKNGNWSKVKIDNKLREKCLTNWNSLVKLMKENHGKQQYDCIIGYSGGKDSTALLYKFVNEYNLTPLAITVDTGFMTNVAKRNIKDTLNKMNMRDHHILIDKAVGTFNKLYKWHFCNHFSNERSLTVNICDFCSDLIHSIVVKEAIKRNINIVIFGYSPDQIKRYFYEIPRVEILNEWKPEFMSNNLFDKNDLEWYIDSHKISINNLPRVLLPYHVLEYDEKKIIQFVESKELIEVGKADPILTNCHVVKAALLYDLYRYGGLTYALQYAELIRQEKDADARKRIRRDWLRIYKRTAQSILKGTFNIDGMKCFFENIGVTKEDLLDLIFYQREKDPNKDQILKNIGLIKSKKFK